eukprot:7753325-Alexandrium_andersonii.AAC.1
MRVTRCARRARCVRRSRHLKRSPLGRRTRRPAGRAARRSTPSKAAMKSKASKELEPGLARR